ncbi:type II secretion system protein GspG [Candidatus Uabimicrobium amorphum]|uniref:Type II secretion system protein GspG n=1 Tax=Uabimicrobium amorphum TaxID=2596890 RepID=A0A5S9F158_UABAM|nr:type II secretion system protein GspG [Candidatus Uabimicrobium amorphum]BBM81753.1 type II secretion system protein GspG [Candidatus Uabimicrobium amorphum]
MKKFDFIIIPIIIVSTIALFTLILQEIFPMHYHAQKRTTAAKTQLKEWGNVLKLYKMKQGVYPNALKTLTIPNKSGDTFIDAIPIDPWGYEYSYTKKNGKFEIVCFGADGIPGGTGENSDIKYSELHKKSGE